MSWKGRNIQRGRLHRLGYLEARSATAEVDKALVRRDQSVDVVIVAGEQLTCIKSAAVSVLGSSFGTMEDTPPFASCAAADCLANAAFSACGSEIEHNRQVAIAGDTKHLQFMTANSTYQQHQLAKQHTRPAGANGRLA